MKTTKINRFVTWKILINVSLLPLLFACGSQKNVFDDKIHSLESEITRLRAENVNLLSRKAALDDKILLMEKVSEECKSSTPELKVVRLVPNDEDYVEEPEQIVKLSAVPKKDKGKRPVLKLVGAASGRVARNYNSTRVVLPPLPVGASGDNLGVVNGSGDVARSVVLQDPMEQFQRAYRAYANKQYQKAESELSRFVAEHPSHGFADNALFWKGESLLAQGKLMRAIGEYERLLRRFPRSEKGPSTLYRIGFVYDKLFDYAKAKEYYFKVVDRHPGTDAARKAGRRVATLKNESGRGPRLISTSVAGR